ncbi:unnamed protein product, partial [Hapterophycus canaliculatus]
MAAFHLLLDGDCIACLKVFGVGIDAGGTNGAVTLDETVNASCCNALRCFADLSLEV